MTRHGPGTAVLAAVLVLLATVAVAANARWTFAVYLNGDNNLEADAIDDFLEMASVGSTEAVNIVVLFDRRSAYSSAYDDWTTARRGLVATGDVPDAKWGVDMGELDMGATNTLRDFVTWTRDTYPADHLALVIWNHGGGWRAPSGPTRAISWDDTNGGNNLLTNDVQTALAAAGGNVDVIGFDACLMGMVEVAYELRNLGTVMVASSANEPTDGWPFDSILGELTGAPETSPAGLGISIVERYYASYGNDQTLAAVSLPAMSLVGSAANALATALTANWNGDRVPIATAATAVQGALNTAIIIERHGPGWPGAHGLAIYLPPDSPDSAYGTATDFGQDTAWNSFIQTYTMTMTNSWVADACDTTQVHDDDGDHLDLYDFCDELIARSLRIQTAAALPPATVGAAYSESLAAGGGIPPYTWSLSGGYHETVAAGTWQSGGTAQGWRDDDDAWQLDLPWAFPFYGNTYTKVWVCSNGYLDFGDTKVVQYTNNIAGLSDQPRIAALWDDLYTDGAGGDIFVTSGPEALVVRWVGKSWDYDAPVDFQVILYPDGRIRLNYAILHQFLTPTVGVSAGTGSDFLLSDLNGAATIVAGTERLITPVAAALPPGLDLDPATGVVTGTPTAAGDYLFGLTVHDSRQPPGEDSGLFTMAVAPAEQSRSYPLVNGYSLLAVPFTGTGLDDAASLVAWLPDGQAVWGWDAAAQQWLTWVNGLGGTNFPIAPGAAVLADCDPGTAIVKGQWPATVKFSLDVGHNLVSLPQSQASLTTAAALLAAIPNARGVWTWDGNAQRWVGYLDGFGGTDFPITPGAPFLVAVTAATTWPAE